MLNTMSRWLAGTPRRMVQGGLSMFFAGGAALFLGLLARLGDSAADAMLAERYPDLPTWFVPEGPAGYAVAATMVCWGVWAMGSGLRLAREASSRRR
jgi:hypothetical protein